MQHTNIEIKARLKNADLIRQILKKNCAEYIGTDNQIDTYFKINKGRLKLRKGNIEDYLIYYERENQEGPKKSKVILLKNPVSPLEAILKESLEVLVVVDKKREIYFIDNVKFHIDSIKNLGNFMEIEAIDSDDSIGIERLREQCNFYIDLFGIKENDLIDCSYSDLLLKA